jgi:hypothetical protein
MINKLSPLILLALIVSACAGPILSVPTVSPTALPQSAQENDIREAVFRYQFEHNTSGAQQTARFYCLSLGEYSKELDPDDELMQRFQGHKPAVKKISQCVCSPEAGVKDKETGQLGGLVFRATSIKWISDTEVEVKGGYYEGGLSSSGNVYQVVQKEGQWIVTKDQMQWIS